MAKHMNLNVVAEGVENTDQLRFLDDKGCHIYQGNYFSEPLPKASFMDYLDDMTGTKSIKSLRDC